MLLFADPSHDQQQQRLHKYVASCYLVVDTHQDGDTVDCRITSMPVHLLMNGVLRRSPQHNVCMQIAV
jgi:hypothetical protein